MRIFRDNDPMNNIKNPVVTIGSFDGVHLGHQTIINNLKKSAKKIDGETVLITFFPHPRIVLFPEHSGLKLINTQEEKIKLLEQFGIDNLIIFTFTKQFSKISSIDFIRHTLVSRINAKKLIIGYDHHFGKNREGDFEHLFELGRYYNFEVEEIQAKDIEDISISSTKIRQALKNFDIKTANKYLNYDYPLSGKVVIGKQLGRSIGFPTANIEVKDPYKLIPSNGVYVVKVEIQEKYYKGMLYIGKRPTLSEEKISVEVNIFDFNQNIYDENITVYFKDFIREEIKFVNFNALKNQLEKDKEKALSTEMVLS
ncbi:MAG: riboflavin biosynthesis protein RibF [Bacteroidetes bacterium GWE2_29_8]|nr:MAG: riboflavin biosynthesis protein RibF [Bacteroidetes bacterium GWE2_29_8]OFY17149.1 MAG: riboflavin biosynthesis protein RibF [Bacteroidetes bacterium GWF2_29_10]